MYLHNQCTNSHWGLRPGERCEMCGGVADQVTGGVIYPVRVMPYTTALTVQRAHVYGRPGPPVEPSRPDWWRCDGCGHAVPWWADGRAQLACPHCGAQLPARYDQ